jgi:methyltransferase-like protein
MLAVIFILFSSFSSNPNIGANLRQLLVNKFQKTSTRELKPIFTAVTQSILELLSEGYIEKKEKNKGKWGLTDFFKVFVPSSVHHPYLKLN